MIFNPFELPNQGLIDTLRYTANVPVDWPDKTVPDLLLATAKRLEELFNKESSNMTGDEREEVLTRIEQIIVAKAQHDGTWAIAFALLQLRDTLDGVAYNIGRITNDGVDIRS